MAAASRAGYAGARGLRRARWGGYNGCDCKENTGGSRHAVAGSSHRYRVHSYVTPTPGRTAVPESTASAQTPTPEAALSAGDYTALIEAALEYLGTLFDIDDSFIRRMGQSGDTSFVPTLVDMMFFRFVAPRFTGDPIDSALTRLTGVGIESQSWRDWFIWLGRHPEIETPPRFAEWKSQLFQRIDPRISLFFYSGVKARIRLEEIV